MWFCIVEIRGRFRLGVSGRGFRLVEFIFVAVNLVVMGVFVNGDGFVLVRDKARDVFVDDGFSEDSFFEDVSDGFIRIFLYFF